MSLCVALAATVLTIPTTSFSLSWEHSVEKVEWREEWAVTSSGLQLTQANVKGSGAGMEPGEGAVLTLTGKFGVGVEQAQKARVLIPRGDGGVIVVAEGCQANQLALQDVRRIHV